MSDRVNKRMSDRVIERAGQLRRQPRQQARKNRRAEDTTMPLVEPTLLEILACPACHAPLREDPEASELTCTAETGCGLAYPVRDEIPVLLVDEARRPG